MLSYYDAGDRLVPICGLPGCAMYNKRTIFDIVLPRLMACDMILADELAGLGEGGLCLNCDVCTFPNCGFGKGFNMRDRFGREIDYMRISVIDSCNLNCYYCNPQDNDKKCQAINTLSVKRCFA